MMKKMFSNVMIVAGIIAVMSAAGNDDITSGFVSLDELIGSVAMGAMLLIGGAMIRKAAK